MTAIPKTKYEIIVGKDNKRYMKVPVEDIKGALPGPIQMDEQGRQFVLMPVIEQQAPQPAPKKKRPLILSWSIYGVVGCLVLSVIGAIVNRNNPSAPASAPAASAAKPAVTLNAPVAVKAEPTAVPPTEAPAPTQAPPTEVPKPQLAKVGDRVEAGGIALTIVGVSRAASINDIFNPKDGNEFLVIEAIIENVSRAMMRHPTTPSTSRLKTATAFRPMGHCWHQTQI